MFTSLHTAKLTSGRVQGGNTRPGFFTRLRTALALRRQRKQLAEMDEIMLSDIGLSRDQALAEAARPLWDAPAHWLR